MKRHSTKRPNLWNWKLHYIASYQFGQGLGFGLLIWWLHRTSIGMPFALQSLASAPSVGGNGGAGWSAPVGFLGDGKLSHTPSCKVRSHCLGITSTSMLPVGLVQSIQCGGSNFFLRYFSILCWFNPFPSLSFQARLPTTRYLMGGQTLDFHSIGRERVAPQTMSFIHYAHTSSLAQQFTCLR